MRGHIREGRRKDGGSCELPGWLVEWLREGGRKGMPEESSFISRHQVTEGLRHRKTEAQTLRH